MAERNVVSMIKNEPLPYSCCEMEEAWNTRAERTCHPVEKFTEDSPWPVMVCSECGRQLHYDEHREISYQPYCGCGAKVVE
jgi:hypothetical protein